MGAATAPDLTTNYPCPWVLVAHGGQIKGQRPLTKLGFIQKAVAKDNQIVEFRVLVERAPGEFYKSASKYPPSMILHEFQGPERLERPGEKAIAQAKAKLPVV